MNKRFTLLVLCLFSVALVQAASGIWDRAVALNNGTNTYIPGLTFNSQALGTFSSVASTYLLTGGQVKTYKNGSDDVTGARMYYRVVEAGSSAVVPFTLVNLPFGANLSVPGDQVWQTNAQSISFMAGLTDGNYVLEIYFEADYTFTGGNGTHIDNNNGANYKATFTISTALDCSVNLGPDTTICQGGSLVLTAGNLSTNAYSWSTGATTSSITVTQPGTYSVAITNGTCFSNDQIVISTFGGSSLPLSLGNDTSICGLANLTLGGGFFLSPQNDSLTIVYDATQGQSGLAGASKVYFHSSYEAQPFTGPVSPWVGNWGQDDGLGQMDSVGNNLWRITINIRNYYNIPAGSPLNGLFMVFRNADGTLLGKDGNGNDIFLLLGNPAPTSSFAGITPTYDLAPYTSALWSNGATTATISVGESGTYWLALTNRNGCVSRDTVEVSLGELPMVNAGADQNICPNQSATLTATPGFLSYAWSNGATTSSISVTQAGTYTITVTNTQGCTGIDLVNVNSVPVPNADFTYIPNGLLVTFSVSNTYPNGTYQWDFTNDGTIDATVNATNPLRSYPAAGTYNVRLIVTNACGIDTIVKQIMVTGVGLEDGLAQRNLRLHPNPAQDQVWLQASCINWNKAIVSLFSSIGQELPLFGKEVVGDRLLLDVSALPPGAYFLQVSEQNQRNTLKLIKR